MKTIKTLLLVAMLFAMASCADNANIDGKTYRPYGLLNESTCKNDSIEYQISGYAVFSGIFWLGLVAPPIYTFGFNLYEPVRKKGTPVSNKGVVN